MRADRLVSLVLLLRQRGRMTAPALAKELEVSTRTVLRDIEALSVAGVPLYAERGRHGGFALLPGFRTELTGLNNEEALALLTAGTQRGGQALGLGSALTAAMRKVVDALPRDHQSMADDVTQRILVEPETDLLARRLVAEEIPDAVMVPLRLAVLRGRKLRLHYAGNDRPAEHVTVDPLGLVTVRDKGYLLATLARVDKTYRVSRVVAAEVLPEPAERPDVIDLDRLWRERSARFRAGEHQVTVVLRLAPGRREELVATAVALLAESTDDDGWLRLEVSFQDARHAEWALWQLGTSGEAVSPDWLRLALRHRAESVAVQYAEPQE